MPSAQASPPQISPESTEVGAPDGYQTAGWIREKLKVDESYLLRMVVHGLIRFNLPASRPTNRCRRMTPTYCVSDVLAQINK
jgi:hypothetical protein